MGYSDQENERYRKNERDIWEYVCASDHLHARDPMVIRHHMKPAPTVDMPGGQAPVLIDSWVGVRIIASYTKKHKDFKIEDLLGLTDYQSVFEESGYLKL